MAAALAAARLPSLAHADILSSKRGYGDTGASYNGVQATGAGWYYNWGTAPSNIGNYNANFYSMIWGSGQSADSTINFALSVTSQYLLGFNEPERADQANLTVAQGTSIWDRMYSDKVAYNSAHGTSIKLVSPAVADTGAGQAWLSSFMAAEGSKVDAVAFHWYDDDTTNYTQAASDFESRVTSYHNTYGKPVMVTEFADHDWGGTLGVANMIFAEQHFLDIVVPWMESQSYVLGYYQYNWFNDSALYSGSTPTQLGYTYVGAVQAGSTSDIVGTNLGEHVAYLTGGALTMSGNTGTVKYIEALAPSASSPITSTINGSSDWGLNTAASGNWVKVDPGATLLKSGTNTITLGNGTITDNGVIQVSQGALRLASNTSGSGSIVISSDGGATGSTARLELIGGVTVSNAITFAQRNDPGASDGIRNVSGNNTLSGAMTITVGGSQARVRSDAGQLTLGAITTDATSARNLSLQGAGNGVVAGAISNNSSNAGGTINVTKQDGGTWTLSGANTYTGTTTVNGGTLGFVSAASNIGGVTVAAGAGLNVRAVAGLTTLSLTSLTLGTVGSMSLTFDMNALAAPSPLVSTGTFTANGTVNVAVQNAGVLLSGTYTLVGYTAFAGAGTFSGSPFTLGPRSTGTLVNNGTNALSLSVVADRPVWSGLDNGNWVAATTGANGNWKLQSNAGSTDYLQGDNVLFDDSATGSTAINLSAASVSPIAVTFNNSAKNYTISSAGGFGITGSAAVTKNGSGTVTLANVNAYTGGTTINAGTIAISADNNLGPGSVILNGGTLKTTAGIVNAHAITVAAGGGTINVNSTGSGGTGQYYFNTTNALTGSGPLTLSGNGSLNTTGAGNMRVDHTNSYSGNLTVQSGGIFEYGTAGAVAAGATFAVGNQGEISVQGGGAGVSMPNNITVTGGASSVLSFENGNAGVFAAPVALNGNLTVALRDWYNYSNVHSGTISGVISGTGNVTVNSGSGTGGALTLSGANTFSGNVTVTASTVNATFGANDATINGRGWSSFGNEQTPGKTVTIGAGGTVSLATGNVLGSGASTIAQAPVLKFVVNQGGLLQTSAADVGGPGGGDANIFGPITLNGATFTAGNGYNADYQAVILLKDVTVGGVAASAINTNASNTTANSIMLGDAASGTDAITFNVADATNNASADLTVSAKLTNSANSTSNPAAIGALTKAGAGTMVLSGANTYSGPTTINAGTLQMNSTNATSASVTVNSGGTLALNAGDALGVATGKNVLTINSGTVSNNMSTGRVTIWNDLTMTGGTLTGTGSGDGNGAYTLNTQVIATSDAGGNAATISGGPIGLQNRNVSGGSITFNVARGPATPASDLIVSANLIPVSFASGIGITKSGNGIMMLSGANTFTAATSVNGGTLTIAAAGSMASTSYTVAGGATLNVSGVIPAGSVIADSGTVSFAGNGSGFIATRNVAALNITGGGVAKVLTSTAGAATPLVLKPATLSIDAASNLDLTNNELVAPGSADSALMLIQSGQVFSSALADANHALGYISVPSSSNMEVRYALKGDANLDGSVDVGDLGALATSYGASGGQSWINGDSNQDGNIDVGDLGALATNYGSSLASSPAEAAVATAVVADSSSSVPEPSMVGVIVLAALCYPERRRNRRSRRILSRSR